MPANNETTENADVPQAEFADILPRGCPPSAAVVASGIYYAAHYSMPPGADDFRTAAERGIHERGNECLRCGNSVMRDRDHAKHLCRLFKGVFRYVSEAELKPEHGVMFPTPSSKFPTHHTLWRHAGVTMHAIFIRLAE